MWIHFYLQKIKKPFKNTALETITKNWSWLRFFRFFSTKPLVHSFDFCRIPPLGKPKSFDYRKFLFDDFPLLFDWLPLTLKNRTKPQNKGDFSLSVHTFSICSPHLFVFCPLYPESCCSISSTSFRWLENSRSIFSYLCINYRKI